ncbi:hypothetical protein ACFO0N_07785 [Halobium salinum]|uniref:Ig-like domain-containing protein n=1 Tax=Halobium salinum TaxID=1364940 RepID=A0ABD5PAA8_9EURY|nr:hypothetical protein [Halobium salinum]
MTRRSPRPPLPVRATRRSLLRGVGLATVAGLGGCLTARRLSVEHGLVGADDLLVTEISEPEGLPMLPPGVDDGKGGGDGDAEGEDGVGGVDGRPEGPVVASLAVAGPDGRSLLGDDPPHSLWVVNAAGEARAVTARLSTGGESVVERTATFPAGGRAFLELRVPASYEFVVRSGGSERREDVAESWFDCNSSSQVVVVTGDGIEAAGVSTQMGCPSLPWV